MDKTDRLRDYGLAFLLYEQGLGVCGYELIRELFIFIKLILNSYLIIFFYCLIYYILINPQYIRNHDVAKVLYKNYSVFAEILKLCYIKKKSFIWFFKAYSYLQFQVICNW